MSTDKKVKGTPIDWKGNIASISQNSSPIGTVSYSYKDSRLNFIITLKEPKTCFIMIFKDDHAIKISETFKKTTFVEWSYITEPKNIEYEVFTF